MPLHRAIPLILAIGLLGAADLPRTIIDLDWDWRFLQQDTPGAEQPAFSDATWRRLDVPHDWSIEGSFDQNHATAGPGGFLPSGVGWYRKHFTLPTLPAGGRASVTFDGVMANSEVWINGHHLGRRPNGYVDFTYDLTNHLKPAGEQILVVRTDTSGQPASRWYTGAGIYRHVHLTITGPVHIPRHGIAVTTPTVARDQATVAVRVATANRSGRSQRLSWRIAIIDADGHTAATAALPAQELAAGTDHDIQATCAITAPRCWGPAAPHLYRARVQVLADGIVVDQADAAFGIREARFEAATGFWLNGENLKLKGVCLHHDGGAVGAAVPLSIWERRLTTLRELGVNAIRCSHNQPATEFLDLCDRLGFLVLDEFFDCWVGAKLPHDYHRFFKEWSLRDLADGVRRDRNHPCIIAWSVGNEIRDTPKAELAKGILRGLVDTCHREDPSRPVTQGLFRPNVSKDYDNGLADMLDVVGQNYREAEILAAHAAKPTRRILGTENGHDRKVWLALRDHAPYAGQFLWTGIDYLGESRRWPVIGFGSGLCDRAGLVRPVGFQRASWWSSRSVVHACRRVAPTEKLPTDPGWGQEERFTQVLFPDWTPRIADGKEVIVEVYSNCPQTDLRLNGRSLGVKPLSKDATPLTWKVPFATGTLVAHGLDAQGVIIASHELRTAGQATRIALVSDRPTLATRFDDIALVTALVTDDQGVPVPDAAMPISFQCTGPGLITATDNGDNTCTTPFTSPTRNACGGRVVGYVRAISGDGTITVTASAAGLAEGVVRITVPTAETHR